MIATALAAVVVVAAGYPYLGRRLRHSDHTRQARFTRAFLWLLSRTVNPVAIRAARAGRGPFSLVRHVGRRTGRVYETPLILARVNEGFIAELTYGTNVSWYRNVLAAGGCSLVVDGVDRVIDAVEPYPTDAGRRAFGIPAAWLLKMLGRTEFRLLREAGPNRENVTTISGPGESPAIGEQPRLGPPSHSAP